MIMHVAVRLAGALFHVTRALPSRHVTSHVMQAVLTRQASTSASSSVGWDGVETFTAAVFTATNS